jgi:hypothetical protein
LVKIRPSNQALFEIRSAIKACKGEVTLAQLKEMTGYEVAIIQAARKLISKKIKAGGRPPQSEEDREAPVFIKEIQQNTGLECIKERTVRSVEQWILLAPTGLPLMRLVGRGDLLQFARNIQEPAKVLQGITSLEIEERRKARLRKHKK